MASLENDHLVVNVVYTGPPLAGKTQSVKALMPLLKGRGAEQKVFSPGDWRGRTAFFDWAEYEGGAYEGKPIQCRIISTPGQVALSDRRELLLRSADAVILVIDSRAEALERAVQSYEEMAPWLADSSREVPVRVVLQCNKQDLPGSLSPEDLVRRVRVPCGKDVYATSASTGKGLRAAFVAGVRNAVDRARALIARGLLEPPEITSGEELFELMRRETAPIGSLRPSSPSLGPSTSRPSSMGSHDADSAAPMRAKRSRLESAHPQGARASNRAGASSSGSTRPSAPKEAPSSGPGQFPFGAGKSKSSSGFYPSMTARASSAAPRASQPSLPPDHPFASNAPSKPSTRRPSGGASRRAASTRTGSSATGASSAVPRPKAGEGAVPSSGDEPARGRPLHHSGANASLSGRRGLAASDSTTTGTRVRPSRPDAGARSPLMPTDVFAARASGEAGATALHAGDTRPLLGAFASYGTQDAPLARAPALLESHRDSTASVLFPALEALGSTPPSSATSAPMSATRALLPPHSEPRAMPEPAPGPPPGPHPEGWLDPAGEVARAWRPGEGERPAIMPASVYHALTAAELEARSEQLALASGDRPAEPAQDSARDGATTPAAAPEAPALPARPRATAQTFAAGGPRPAVMPASAYFAILAQREARLSAGAREGAAGAESTEPACDAPPAVPTAASDASFAGGSPLPLSTNPATSSAFDDPVDSGWPDAGEVLSLPAPFAAPQALRVLPGGTSQRPGEGDAPGAASEAAEARNDDAAQTGASERGPAPTTVPSQARSEHDTPTITPSAPLDLLATERETLAPSPASAPDRDPPSRSEFADPAAFGLESSRLIAPATAPSEESSESFRIPETPPGLQAFVIQVRHSSLPPSLSDDEVIQSLPPAIETAIDRAAPRSMESAAPSDFPGPRMPGHLRAPLAVWRRSTWRTLETHINSDATALEDARGRWIGELAPGWYARTLRSATDERAARRAFAEEVLRERRLGQYLSRPRCVVLTREEDRYWVWQAACRVPTLAAVLGRRLAARESTSAMAEALLDASLAFVEARQRFIRGRVPLPLSLHALSVQDDKLVYSGLLPDPGAVFVHPPNDGHSAFEDALRKKWPRGAAEGAAIVAELSSKAAGRLPEPLLEIIRSIVGQSSREKSTNEVSA